MKITEPNIKHPYVLVKPDSRSEKLSDISDADIISLYKTHGAILFRGFDGSVDEFAQLGDRFISGSVAKHDLSRKSVTTDHRVQTVNEGGQEFYMHPEIGREPWQPDMALFNCQIAPWRLGQTTLVDGIAIANALKPETRELLKNNDLEFTNVTRGEIVTKWTGLTDPSNDELIEFGTKYNCYFRKHNDEYQRIHRRPALHKPMFSDELAFGNYLLFARFHNKRDNYPTFINGEIIPQEICEELQHLSQELNHAHKWKKHDIIILDNTRFMHGRKRIASARGRKILARFGFINFYNPAPEVLAEQPWRSSGVWMESDWQ